MPASLSVTSPFRGKLRIRHLEMVLTVAEMGNMSKAAIQVHSTQSGLSRAIAEVEEIVGARLFERSARGMVCTPMGEAMCRHARLLLGDFRKAEVDLAAVARGDQGSLNVGCFSLFSGWPLGDAARDFRTAYPRVTLAIEVGTHEQLIDRLDAGGLDVLISRFPSSLNPEVYRSVNLLMDGVVFLCAASHPLAGIANTVLADYIAYPWITALPGSRIRGELERSLRDVGLDIPEMIGALSLEFGRELLLQGQYLWMLPSSVATVMAARDPYFVLPAKPTLEGSPLAAIWRRDRSSSSQARAFAAALAQVIEARDVATEM